jgi:hypothetical protein
MCAIFLTTPLGLLFSLRGLLVDSTKWCGLAGLALSGAMLALTLASAF